MLFNYKAIVWLLIKTQCLSQIVYTDMCYRVNFSSYKKGCKPFWPTSLLKIIYLNYFSTGSFASFLNTTNPSNTSTKTGFDLSISPARIRLLKVLIISF